MTELTVGKSNREVVDALRFKRFPVPSDGFVCLVDCMGCDEDICAAARVSYQAGTKQVSDDETLLRYLMRHRHSTPFEMAELKFCVRVPMDTWRQWIRHRMASVNEYSTRYSEAIDARMETDAGAWRLQSDSNKQGSGGYLTEWPEDGKTLQTPAEAAWRESGQTPGSWLTRRECQLHRLSDEIYKERLDFNVAREQARKDLPLSTYTEAYWKIDLHNLMHFLGLRMDSHAQLEIRQYANIIGDIVEQLFPLTWAAFLDYRLNAMTLSARDIAVFQLLNKFDYVRSQYESSDVVRGHLVAINEIHCKPDGIAPELGPSCIPASWLEARCRERDEFVVKINKLLK